MINMPYSIDAVARLTGISAFTLRNWEKRYDFLKPNRLGNGFRAYDDNHVALLKKVAALLRHGARIGDLAESIRKGKPLPEVKTAEFAPEVEEHAIQLYSALIEFDTATAELAHAKLHRRLDPVQMLDLVYGPLLGRIGGDWNAGLANLAQEHFVSAFIRLRLAPYLSQTPPAPAPGQPALKRAICATTPGETHEGGLMLVTAHLALRGWATYYLGTNLPLEDLKALSRKIRPNVICLSFTDPHGIESVVECSQDFECRVCLGGFGALTFDGEDRLPKNLHLFKTSGRDAVERIEESVLQ